MQAIIVKYLPATATKPSRLKAFTKSESVTVSYHSVERYKEVAEMLREKLGWDNCELVEGWLPDNSAVYVAVRK